MRELLSAPVVTSRAFRPTMPPSADGVCPGAGATGDDSVPAGSSRLLVVQYAGANAPHVNLAIQFANNSDALAPESKKVLDRLALVLNEPATASASFAVAGHTDATGPAKLNLELSCARSIAVRQYLMERGVAPVRLSSYGFGSSKPLDADKADSAQNRRVEIRKAS